MKDYSAFSKEDLLKLIQKIETHKRYGLVWDEENAKEQFEKESENALPVLEELKNMEIKTDASKPTNIMIEGDNYHALSVLNYTHQGKIDVIYIDPPYNTGGAKEWKFNDSWVDKTDTYRHSKWLSFISKRLRLAKNLLSDSGVILISIDDNEYAQLKILCDMLFVEKNFVGSLVWEKKKKGSHLDESITNVKEYVLVYCKNSNSFKGLIGEVNEDTETYPCLNPGNGYSIRKIPAGTKSNYSKEDIKLPKGHVISSGNMKLTLESELSIEKNRLKKDVIIKAEWRYDQDSLNDYASKDELYFTRDLYLRRIVNTPRYKRLKDLLLRTNNANVEECYRKIVEEYQKEHPNMDKIKVLLDNINEINESDYKNDINPNNLYTDGWGSNEDGDNELRDFFGEKVFDYPKPSRLIEKLIAATGLETGTVLDFFAGSGTTAHAVMKLVKKGRKIQFILCTNNEDNNSSGLKIATHICYPRIKKVIKGYKDRNKSQIKGLDGNLKYFKTAFVVM